ncbi:hypothetical protein H072_2245 [Dactylellina haptotyla CBS 200.50]|uniref:Uncharacterized protein n=1 Tax=Dactylellina haptotyla (strain CBS 200.50) TaxID=1284197 RepID=S8ALJ8_DACHA|nr:hypothetical protein H072_2245 [Dactylellina haptotyla CBS 200.50]
MRRADSIANAVLLVLLALTLAPLSHASVYAVADGVNSNALEKLKALKRSEQRPYHAVLRGPLNLLKRQDIPQPDPSPPTDLNTPSNTSSTAFPDTTSQTSSPATTTTIDTSSITSQEKTSTPDGSSSSPCSVSPEPSVTSEPPVANPTSSASDGTPTAPSSGTDLPSSPADTSSNSQVPSSIREPSSSPPGPGRPNQETSSTGTSPGPVVSETPTGGLSTTGTSNPSTESVRTTLDVSAKSAFTSPYSTSTVTLPNGAVSTVTQYLVVIPTTSPTRAQNPEESQTMSGTASLHTNGASHLYNPKHSSVAALVAVLGYIGAVLF